MQERPPSDRRGQRARRKTAAKRRKTAATRRKTATKRRTIAAKRRKIRLYESIAFTAKKTAAKEDVD